MSVTVASFNSRQQDKDDFLAICDHIKNTCKTESEWTGIESCDLLQIGNFCGGYNADERAFCFSYYLDEDEYWFQLTLREVDDISQGKKSRIALVKVNTADAS